MTSRAQQAGCWLARSGIQESNGGVARYYRSDLERNAPISAEITGYAVSAFAYLHSLDGTAGHGDAAIRAARYLADEVWDRESHTFHFEPESPHAYFFDIGIVARGLMSAWRLSGDEHFRERAHQAALSLAFDFLGDGVFHPVISLPGKQPLAYEPRWSRQPGCYQLKSALAWRDLGDEHASRLFGLALDSALATHDLFLSGEADRERLMDRLHAYCYFLEALLAVSDREEPRRALDSGIHRVGALLREVATDFERSDVCAQLLRLRLIAHHLDAVPLDEPAAREEAERAACYQIGGAEAHRLRGGFWFGKKCGIMLPFVNPVSTVFCLQALALWEAHCAGRWRFGLHELI
ncbi:MAG: hypothetical protein ACRD30_01905 [Bryobacteraceae bacterium]